MVSLSSSDQLLFHKLILSCCFEDFFSRYSQKRLDIITHPILIVSVDLIHF